MKLSNSVRILSLSFIANAFLSIIKIVFGCLGNSRALFVDGIHSLSDLIGDVIAILGSKFSDKKADLNHPKGHGKVEYLTSIIIGLIVIFLGYNLLMGSIALKKASSPKMITVLIIAITIVVKYFLANLLIRKGNKLNSNILISSGKESYADIYSSILVFIMLVTSQFSKYWAVLNYADIIASIIVSLLIIFTGLKLIYENSSLLIGEKELSKEINDRVKKLIKACYPSLKVKELHLYKLGKYYEAHLTVELEEDLALSDVHLITEKIEDTLKSNELNIEYVVTKVIPSKKGEANARTTRSRNSKKKSKKESSK